MVEFQSMDDISFYYHHKILRPSSSFSIVAGTRERDTLVEIELAHCPNNSIDFVSSLKSIGQMDNVPMRVTLGEFIRAHNRAH